jgi:DNA-directed RNA polymerase specialized sigma24 family protein
LENAVIPCTPLEATRLTSRAARVVVQKLDCRREQDDLRQQAWVILHELAGWWNAEKSKFFTWAWLYLPLQLLTWQLDQWQARRKHPPVHVSLPSQLEGRFEGFRLVDGHDEVSHLLSFLSPAYEHPVRRHFVDGLTFKEIARESGRTWKCTNTMCGRGVRRLRFVKGVA